MGKGIWWADNMRRKQLPFYRPHFFQLEKLCWLPGIFPGSRLLSTSLTIDAYSTLETQVICLSECCILLDNFKFSSGQPTAACYQREMSTSVRHIGVPKLNNELAMSIVGIPRRWTLSFNMKKLSPPLFNCVRYWWKSSIVMTKILIISAIDPT